MSITFRKLFLSLTFNTCMFLMLVIGIQNSSLKSKVSLINNETVKLPVSFIIGLSFISGSIFGSFLNISTISKSQNL